MEVVILQGIPGVGKSTWAKQEQKQRDRVEIVSADHFMVNEHGEYKFDVNRLPECHAKCGQAYLKHLQAGRAALVIVDNTNTGLAEVAPYYAVAQWFSAEVLIYYWQANLSNPMEQGQRSVHNVPELAILAMHERLERFAEQMPPWWNRGTETYDNRVL